MIQVNISVKMILFLDTLCLSGDNIHKGNNSAAVRKLQVSLNVSMRDSACTDDSHVDHFYLPLMKY